VKYLIVKNVTITRDEKVNGQDTLRPTNIQYLQILTKKVRTHANVKSYIPITPFYIPISIDAPSQYIQVVSLEASVFL
jgi:homoserine trans-succinylase